MYEICLLLLVVVRLVYYLCCKFYPLIWSLIITSLNVDQNRSGRRSIFSLSRSKVCWLVVVKSNKVSFLRNEIGEKTNVSQFNSFVILLRLCLRVRSMFDDDDGDDKVDISHSRSSPLRSSSLIRFSMTDVQLSSASSLHAYVCSALNEVFCTSHFSVPQRERERKNN